jgi:hypothetical protein
MRIAGLAAFFIAVSLSVFLWPKPHGAGQPAGEPASPAPSPQSARPYALPVVLSAAEASPGPQAARQDRAARKTSAGQGSPASVARLSRTERARPASASSEPAYGWLLVKSNPPFAQVRVDESEFGRTPVISPLRLGAGIHRIGLQKEGCLPLHAEVLIRAGETTGVRLSLERDTAFHP